jgi:hypothetical protein
MMVPVVQPVWSTTGLGGAAWYTVAAGVFSGSYGRSVRAGCECDCGCTVVEAAGEGGRVTGAAVALAADEPALTLMTDSFHERFSRRSEVMPAKPLIQIDGEKKSASKGVRIFSFPHRKRRVASSSSGHSRPECSSCRGNAFY